ncbi:MAG: TRAP transporter substrate-binding protein [Gemmatimonadetes bacterium]|nr:TRAP transporter substrate-binding protein [Gemmatimonadota bacterium]
MIELVTGAQWVPARRGGLLAWGLLALAACAGEPAGLEIRLAHSASPRSLIALSAEEFARRANERLGSRARVVVYGSAQLGSDEVVLSKLKLGTVDIGLNSTVMESVVDEFALFEMPYLVQDREHMLRIEHEVFWPSLAPRAEAAGYEILALWENGFRHITNNTRAIVTPRDLEGIKLRTPSSPWRLKLFRRFGANPAPLPFTDLFLALQTGLMDGQENPLSNVVTAKLDEVQTFLSLTGHVYSPAYVTVGAESWAALPEGVRTILEETARETQQFALATGERLDTAFLDQLRESGMVVNEADRASFARASESMYEEFGAAVPDGRALIEAALALAR